jgi:hypothetical protein
MEREELVALVRAIMEDPGALALMAEGRSNRGSATAFS